MSSPMKDDADWAFNAYEAVRARLPQPVFAQKFQTADNLSDIADRFDTFLLDSFGVLNIGATAIPGAVARIEELRALGKRIIIVTNAAGYPKHVQIARYKKLGFDFTADQIVSSRGTALAAIAKVPQHRWGLMAAPEFGRDEIDHLDADFLEDDATLYDAVDAFLLLGSSLWTQSRQNMLEASLRRKPRPVFVGNPDIVAPVENGLSRQPGHYAHRLADATGVEPQFFGKPFFNIFEQAFARLGGDYDPGRTLMVGDTLHTDILGGRAAGVKTALITQYGSLAETDAEAAIKMSGIVPDYVLLRP
jgi:HAD superfamily hydrolase (TIGR01450 family)